MPRADGIELNQERPKTMDLHKSLTETPSSLFLACAGAGIEFLRQLWQTPGSSRYLCGTSLLQAREELDRFIGYSPEGSYCSKAVAIDMAISAFLQASRSGGDGSKPVGLAVTAAVASDRIPRGEQRAQHVLRLPAGEDLLQRLPELLVHVCACSKQNNAHRSGGKRG